MSDPTSDTPPSDLPPDGDSPLNSHAAKDWPATAAMRRAIEALQRGQGVEAEEIVLGALRDAEGRFGKESHQYATAQNELGTVLLGLGQTERAIAAFQVACEGPEPMEPPAVRDRLTFLMNLGQALAMSGRLDEAEQTLRQGLAGRVAVYGREHPGYAFGLEPLAELLMQRGKAGEALEMLRESTATFWKHGHPRVATSLGLRAEALKATGRETKDAPPFADLDKLPVPLIEQIAQFVVNRVGTTDPLISRKVLADLVPLAMKRLGEAHAWTLAALSTAANLERTLGPRADHRIRQGAIQLAVGAYDRTNRPIEALQAVMGLALAYSDAGRNERAVITYNDAVTRAEKLDDPTLRAQLKSQVLRNFGLLLSEMKRPEEAEGKLGQALGAAEASGDAEMIARAQIALGIFLQHGGRGQEAKELLESATRALDPAHPDAISGRSHLNAIVNGGNCGCGDTGLAMAEAFKQFVLARLPEGLVDRLEVKLKDKAVDPASINAATPESITTAADAPAGGRGGVAKDFEMGVHLKREPTEAELEQLNRVMNQAVNEFRQRIQEAR